MTSYLKILVSAFTGAFVTAATISVGAIFSGNINGYPLFLLFGTAIGFVSYGLPGSLLWWAWHRYYLGAKQNFRCHKLSAIFSAAAFSATLFLAAIVGFIGIVEAIFGVLAVSIGATITLCMYYLIFIRQRHKA